MYECFSAFQESYGFLHSLFISLFIRECLLQLLFEDLEIRISWESVGQRRKITALTMQCKWRLQRAVQFWGLTVPVSWETGIRNHCSILLTTKLPNLHVKDGLFSQGFIIYIFKSVEEIDSWGLGSVTQWLCAINLWQRQSQILFCPLNFCLSMDYCCF